MSEATSIDKLSIEIVSNSNSAAQGIKDLASALGELKGNGSVGVAVKNLNNLSEALRKLTPVTSNANKLSALAKSVDELSKAGSFSKVINQLNKLPEALRGLSSLNVDNSLGAKLESLAQATVPLSNIKTGGLGTMVNALSKIGKVTDSLDDDTITRFADRIKKLNDELGPLSTKMTTIQSGLRGINSSARSASGGVRELGTKVHATSLNLASMVTVLEGAMSVLRPIVRLLAGAITQAMEWDGISYQFGKAFGEQADEYAQKITEITDALKINKQEFMGASSMIASMLKGFGVGSEDAREMGIGYTELAYDIWAAFNNVYKTLDGADGAMAAIRSAVSGEVEPIRRAGFTIVDSQLKITAANYGIAYSSEKATEAQKSYLRYLTLVDQAANKGVIGTYANEVKTAEGLTRTLTQQVKSLAQSFGSLFLPILVEILPWLQAFVELLTETIALVAGFFGIDIQPATWGSAFDGVSDSADAATDSLDSAAGAAGSAKKAVEDLKKATLGIDELNVISPPTESGGGGGGGGGGLDAFEGLDVGSIWDKAILDQVQFEADKIKDLLEESLSSITALISGFMLAIGTILVVSGANIPLGLALMATGALGLVTVIAANWSNMSDQLAKTLTGVTAVLGGFLLAIGAFLAFSGVNVGLGAALMVAGAVSLGTALTINWKFLEGNFENTLSILTGIISGGLLAMGALFAFTGVSVGLGIGLMVAGAVGLATTVGLNWDAMSEPLRKAVGTMEMIVGTAMLSFGAILAFSGANIPLGIALIAAGAVSMVAAEQLNWNSLNGTMESKIATLTTLVGGAALGLGAVLAFSGVALPVGIALMALGAAGIVAAAPINWSSLSQSVSSVLKEIGAAVGVGLLAVGAVLALSGVALPLGISLMAAGAVSLVSAVALNWDSITTSVKNVLEKIGIAAGAAMLALGLILCLSGVGIPLGIGLIAAGAGSLIGGVALNWDDLLGKLKTAWGKVESWWQGIKELDPVGVSVSLVKKGWSTVKKWVGDIPSLSQTIKLAKSGWSTVKKWVGSIPALNQAIKLAKSGWSSVKSWVGTMPSLSAKIKLAKDGWSTVKKWLGSLDFKLNFKLPKIGINWGTKEVLGFKISYPKSFYTYAKGGFPDFGELFVAREAGPEMVGKIGNRTTVANNDQIVEGISEGVYSAVVAAMKASESNGAQAVNVYLDGKLVTQSVEKRQHERGASIMGRQVYSY